MLDYDATMRIGHDRYRDVLDLLVAAGLPATFTQTGGMCAALEVVLDGGHTLLITDAEDPLSWDRDEHHGWGVGLFPPDQADTAGECLAFDAAEDGALQALLPVIRRLLGEFTRRERP